MGKSLEQFVHDNSKFLKLLDGQSFEGTYHGYRIITNRFDPDKETVQYKLKYASGKEIGWENGSSKTAVSFSKAKEGDRVKITRNGEGTSTKYDIKIILNGIIAPLPYEEQLPF